MYDDFGDFDDSDESESSESSASESFFSACSVTSREDDTALLMKELQRVKKEKELARKKEVGSSVSCNR